MVPRLLVLALELYRAPLRFRHLTDPAAPLPHRFGDWLSEALAAVTPAKLPATAQALAAEPSEIEAALVFFVRQVLLLPHADHYRVLGLPRQATDEAIRQHYSLLVRMFHPDRSPESEDRGIALTARINTAYRVLRDPEARRRYDRGLSALPTAPPPGDDALTFFRPSTAVIPAAKRSAFWSSLPGSLRRAGLWALAALSVSGLLLITTREPNPPALRINPDTGRERATGPAYLHQDNPPARPDLSSQAVERASAEGLEGPASGTPASSVNSGADQSDIPDQPRVPDARPFDGAADPSHPDDRTWRVTAQVVIDDPVVGSSPTRAGHPNPLRGGPSAVGVAPQALTRVADNAHEGFTPMPAVESATSVRDPKIANLSD